MQFPLIRSWWITLFVITNLATVANSAAEDIRISIQFFHSNGKPIQSAKISLSGRGSENTPWWREGYTDKSGNYSDNIHLRKLQAGLNGVVLLDVPHNDFFFSLMDLKEGRTKTVRVGRKPFKISYFILDSAAASLLLQGVILYPYVMGVGSRPTIEPNRVFTLFRQMVWRYGKKIEGAELRSYIGRSRKKYLNGRLRTVLGVSYDGDDEQATKKIPYDLKIDESKEYKILQEGGALNLPDVRAAKILLGKVQLGNHFVYKADSSRPIVWRYFENRDIGRFGFKDDNSIRQLLQNISVSGQQHYDHLDGSLLSDLFRHGVPQNFLPMKSYVSYDTYTRSLNVERTHRELEAHYDAVKKNDVCETSTIFPNGFRKNSVQIGRTIIPSIELLVAAIEFGEDGSLDNYKYTYSSGPILREYEKDLQHHAQSQFAARKLSRRYVKKGTVYVVPLKILLSRESFWRMVTYRFFQAKREGFDGYQDPDRPRWLPRSETALKLLSKNNYIRSLLSGNRFSAVLQIGGAIRFADGESRGSVSSRAILNIRPSSIRQPKSKIMVIGPSIKIRKFTFGSKEYNFRPVNRDQFQMIYGEMGVGC